jgi:anti-sigma regulatory factor (Ser/Thr protein kinase)
MQMVDATHKSFPASDRSYFSIIKKEINKLVRTAGFDEKKIGDVDLVVSELTTNLHKYAVDGEILAGIIKDPNGLVYLEIISIDHGPGMSDSQKMMADGYSSANTLGMGLGSINRLSDKFELYSQKDWGTIVLSRINKTSALPLNTRTSNIELRALVVAMPGETVSGDGMYYKQTDKYLKLLVGDGLGHGELANYAVNEAVLSFKSCPYNTPSEILRYIHNDVKRTRGLVGAVVVFDLMTRSYEVAGVGNISVRLSNFLDNKNQMSYNGIIGHNVPNTINNQHVMAADFNQVTLCSDGIRSRWDTIKLKGITRSDLSIQMAAIYKDSARKTDDMSIIMAKLK